jgi:hypothetical protein
MIATVRVVEMEATGVERAGSSSSLTTDGVNGGDEPDITDRQEVFHRK